MENEKKNPNGSDADSLATRLYENFRKEVEDASLLLKYAISQGFTTEDKRKIPDKVIEEIKAMEDLVRLAETQPNANPLPSAEQRASFEKAYRDLAELLTPVTAETLIFTSYNPRYAVKILWYKRPAAVMWSRTLAAITFMFVVFAVIGDVLLQMQGQFAPPIDETSTRSDKAYYYFLVFIQNTIPFTYGAIGACAYLLRSCHQYMIKRQFNKRYIPEYFNRILLGMVSGGSIMMFVSQIAGDKGTAIQLSSAAMGFLTGYNTDFLFSAVERIIQAILPKVGIESVKRAGSQAAAVPSIEGLSAKEIMDNLQKATNDDDKKLYRSLLDKIKDRI